jgi:hypothetical protein
MTSDAPMKEGNKCTCYGFLAVNRIRAIINPLSDQIPMVRVLIRTYPPPYPVFHPLLSLRILLSVV